MNSPDEHLTKEGKADEDLTALRQDIDQIDARLCDLLNQRMELSRRVGAHKRGEASKSPESWPAARFATSLPILHPQREREVMEAAIARTPLAPPCAPAVIYREIMCVGITAYQRTLSLACAQGSEAENHALSRIVRNHFGITAKQTWLKKPTDAIQAVKAGEYIAAIVPWDQRTAWLPNLVSSTLAVIARLPMFIWPFEDTASDEQAFALVAAANPSMLSHPELEGHMLLEPASPTNGHSSNNWKLLMENGPAPRANEALKIGNTQVVGAWPKPLDLSSVRPSQSNET